MNNSYFYLSIKKTIIILACTCLVNCSQQMKHNPDLTANDPLEDYNRTTHDFNKTVDQVVVRPASKLYGNSIPQYFRLGATSFYSNLQEPKRFSNHLMQGQFPKASVDFSRFLINSTLGILGFFDTASWLTLFPEETNFDETLAHWSIPTGPYLEIPFLGPSSLRGSLGLIADYTVNPLLMLSGPVPNISFATFEFINIVNTRFEYAPLIDSILYDSSDSYSSSRLTHFQKVNNIVLTQEDIPFELFDPSEDF